MQYSGATMMWVAILRLNDSGAGVITWLLLWAGCFIVSGSSLLGIPFAGCLLLLAAWLCHENGISIPWGNGSDGCWV